MQSRVLISIGALAVGLTAYALMVALPGAPTPADRPANIEAAAHAGPPAPAPIREDLAVEGLQRLLEPPPAVDIKLPPAQLRRAAEDSFEHMMHTLEELADADKRVPRARRDQLYRETNDVFSALLIQLDPQDAADMQLLEDANIRMKAMLRELEITVPRPTAVLP